MNDPTEDPTNAARIAIIDLADAEFWIRTLHRRSCYDAETHLRLLERIEWLERPWWRRVGRTPPARDKSFLARARLRVVAERIRQQQVDHADV